MQLSSRQVTYCVCVYVRACVCVHACDCVSTFTVTSFLPSASTCSASQFLKVYEDEFIDVVHAKHSLLKLKHKGVISQAVRTSLEDANDENAKYLLFEHLEKNATVDTLREYCKVAIAADGFPRMQQLGRKMMKTLSLGGWLELWPWVQAWVGVCMRCVCLCWPHCKHMLPIIVYSDVL